MLRSRVIIPLVVALAALSGPLFGSPSDLAKDYWLGIYVGKQKFGYVHVTVAQDTFEGKDVYRLTEVARIKVTSSGKVMQEDVTHTLYLDDNFGRIYEVVESRSNSPKAIPQKMEARYGPDSTSLRATSGMTVQRKEVPVSAEARQIALAGSKYVVGALPLKVGDKVQAEFVRVTASLDKGIECTAIAGTLEAVRREKVTVDGKTAEALVVRDSWKGGAVITTQLANGEIVSMTQPGSDVRFERESREKATQIGSTGGLHRAP